MNKKKLLLFFTILLGIFLRVTHIGSLPQGFYSDEALNGYEAYSILKTGKDEYGNRLPIQFVAFGEYRHSLLIYLTVPFVAAFGLNETATRLPSALVSSLALVVVFLMAKHFFSDKVSLTILFMLSISPWLIFLGRMSHETNLATFLCVGGILSLLKFQKQNRARFMYIAVLCFGLSFYAYFSAKVFVPLILITSFALIRKKFVSKNRLILPVVLGLILLAPFFYVTFISPEAGWSRVAKLSILTDPGLIQKINVNRGFLSTVLPNTISKLLINKATYTAITFLGNMTKYLSLQFLFLRGDPNDLYRTPGNGLLMWIESVTIIAGLIFLYRKGKKLFWWILLTIGFSLTADALTRVNPSTPRIELAAPFIGLLSGLGMVWVTHKKPLFKLLVCVLVSVNFGWFLYNYVFIVPQENARAWQIGTKEMIVSAASLAPHYDRVWISRNGWGWIHLLFHTQYDPKEFQKEVKVSARNDLGFWWVSDVGKFHLETLPSSLVVSTKTLFIANPGEFPANTVPIKTIKSTSGEDIYWFVNSLNSGSQAKLQNQ